LRRTDLAAPSKRNTDIGGLIAALIAVVPKHPRSDFFDLPQRLGNMIGGSKVLAVIAARGGSKGLPNKNIIDLAGKPLVAWSIEAARRSQYIDRLILSSENEDIIAVAKRFGCEVPFRRPAELATDSAPLAPVIVHALDYLDETFDFFVLLQPTSPLRTTADIDGAIELCVRRGAPACVGVCQSRPAEWMYRVGDDGRVRPVLGEIITLRRQEQPETYVINGAVYVARVDWYRRHRAFLSPETVAWRMPPERSIDIDTELDLIIARAIASRCGAR
jgi:N-acylneuraminate cytidylyltransferase